MALKKGFLNRRPQAFSSTLRRRFYLAVLILVSVVHHSTDRTAIASIFCIPQRPASVSNPYIHVQMGDDGGGLEKISSKSSRQMEETGEGKEIRRNATSSSSSDAAQAGKVDGENGKERRIGREQARRVC